MRLTAFEPATAPVAVGGYVNALQVKGVKRLLFISGQIPESRAHHTPTDFEGQCRLVWDNVIAALTAADMRVDSLVKVTTYLSDRAHAATNSAVRQQVLGKHEPALTVVIAGLWDPAWLVEIEAIAAC